MNFYLYIINFIFNLLYRIYVDLVVLKKTITSTIFFKEVTPTILKSRSLCVSYDYLNCVNFLNKFLMCYFLYKKTL